MPASADVTAAERRPRRSRRLLSAPVAFTGYAITLFALYFGSGAPTPFFVVWQAEWGFDDWLIPVAFASYAYTFLVALLTGGSLSDHLGRRPVIIASLAVGVVSLVLFVIAKDIGAVIAARALQGLSTGVVTSAFTAALVELARPGSRVGPIIAAAAPVGGLGLGSLIGGIGVELWGEHASEIVFASFGVLLLFGIVVAVFAPETTTRTPGALRSLVPNVVVPPPARSFFVRMLPVLLAAWMTGAFFLAVSPSVVHELGIDSGLVNGLTGALHGVSVSIGSIVFGSWTVRRGLVWGAAGLVVGVGVLLVGMVVSSLPLMWIGGVIEALAFGAAFGAIFRGIAPLAPEHQRAGTFAAIYVAAYLSLGIPVVVAGAFIGSFGLLPTMLVWTGSIVALAVVGFFIQLRRR